MDAKKYPLGMRRLCLASVSGSMLFLLLTSAPVRAAELAKDVSHSATDTDGDRLPDWWEEEIFHSDPAKRDTDGDGFSDLTEIENNFDPATKGALPEGDADADGLNDRLEWLFGSDPTVADTDGDGVSDGKEIANGYSPTDTAPVALKKTIKITLSKQTMEQRLNGVTLATYRTSTGKPGMRTPTGTFHVLAKHPRAWSRAAGLWMPWWMQFTDRGHGIHELPEWPGGKKEGANHLGKPVSHGCVRLGKGSAKIVYDWAPVGTEIQIVR
jgi:hypothetical protein